MNISNGAVPKLVQIKLKLPLINLIQNFNQSTSAIVQYELSLQDLVLSLICRCWPVWTGKRSNDIRYNRYRLFIPEESNSYIYLA